MKRKRIKIKHKNETFGFINESQDGFVIGFPKESPLSHFTCMLKDGRFNVHTTIEKDDGTKEYDKNGRFDICLDDEALKQFQELDWERFVTKYNPLKMKNKVYLGGLFHPLMHGQALQNSLLMLDAIMDSLYIIQARHLRFCQDKMWLVLDKGKGRNSKWCDIGLLYGPFHGDTYYLSFENISLMMKELMSIFKIDERLFDCIYQSDGQMFKMNKKHKTILTGRGRRTIRLNHKKRIYQRAIERFY